jgi:hypothetical protein
MLDGLVETSTKALDYLDMCSVRKCPLENFGSLVKFFLPTLGMCGLCVTVQCNTNS